MATITDFTVSIMAQLDSAEESAGWFKDKTYYIKYLWVQMRIWDSDPL